MSNNICIHVDGPVGAGKSTLMNILMENGFIHFPEPVDENPLLPLFYADKKRYAFSLQMYFLDKRFRIVKDAQQETLSVIDRSIYGDKIFVQALYEEGAISNEELSIYHSILENMLEHCVPPTLMANLQISVDSAIQRIQKRGRNYEQTVERSYWEELNARYRRFFEEYEYSPQLTIDVSDLDFENVPEHRQIVLDKINQKLSEIGVHNVCIR